MISGRTRKELRRLIKNGGIVKQRPKGGKITISIPQIDIPHFVCGSNGDGVSRGPGEEGDVVGKDPQPGDGSGGNQAGDSPGEGIQITIDMEQVLKFMEDELHLPRMKPKENQTFDEVKIKYNDISKQGPESLRHNRRMMKEAAKRMAMTGELDKLHKVPGSHTPVRLIKPTDSDRRYRQFREIRIPTSNAVIFFARDCSASMDDFKCDIASDMSWWIDCWIRKFYDRVDRCYFVHDTMAQEVNEEMFYTYRHGGGTMCSSAFKAVAEQLENRYPPSAYNIYFFYFTDGDNWSGDNERMIESMKEDLGSSKVNMIGISQICSWRYENSVKYAIDQKLTEGELNNEQIRTTNIGPDVGTSPSSMSDEDRNTQIIDGIRHLLSESDEKDLA